MYFLCRLSEGWKGNLWSIYGGAKQLGFNSAGYREPSTFSEKHNYWSIIVLQEYIPGNSMEIDRCVEGKTKR